MAEKREKERGKERRAKAYGPKRACPKCGPGIRLAEHANRLTCGRCGYTEMKGK